MAELFANYFQDSGLSVFDVVAAFLLIRAEQKEEEKARIAANENAEDAAQRQLVAMAREFFPSSPKLSVKAQSLKGPIGSVKSIRGIPKPIDMLDGPEHEAHDTDEEFAEFLNDATTYAPYMLGVYGWKLLVYMHRTSPLRGIRKLMVHRVGSQKISGDNCLRCHEGAIGSHLANQSVDVVHASFVAAASEQVSKNRDLDKN
jgi:hypothetical protein